MNASSLSGECARRISATFGETAGVDMLGPSWRLRESITHLGPTAKTPSRRCEDYDALAVLLVAVKETEVCASSGQSAECANQEYHTPWPNVQTARDRPRGAMNGGSAQIIARHSLAFRSRWVVESRSCSVRLSQRSRFFARQNESRDALHYFQRHMVRPRIVRRLRRAGSMHEKMIQIRISSQRHVLVVRQSIRPSLEIRRCHLIIPSALHDENRNFQFGRCLQRIVAAQVQPIRAIHRRPKERDR